MTKLEGRYFTSRDNSDIYVTKYGTSDIISHGMAPIPKEKAMTKAWTYTVSELKFGVDSTLDANIQKKYKKHTTRATKEIILKM